MGNEIVDDTETIMLSVKFYLAFPWKLTVLYEQA